MHQWSDERIDEAIQVLKPYADEAGEPFTREDAIESMNNLVAFMEVLIEADRDLRKKEMPKFISVSKQVQYLKATSSIA